MPPPYRGFAQVEYDHVANFLQNANAGDFDWLSFDAPSRRNRLSTPLSRARVALVSTAGAYLSTQRPFRLGVRGDASFREIPAASEDLRLAHQYPLHHCLEDLDMAFPLALLREMAASGVIGDLAPRAFSFMGYSPDTTTLMSQSGEAVAQALVADQVDLVLLVPV